MTSISQGSNRTYRLLSTVYRLPTRAGQLLIRSYQRTLSPDHGPLARFFPGPVCIYYPSCSDYSYQALEKYGLIKGVWLTGKRIARCTPWHKGGEDPVA